MFIEGNVIFFGVLVLVGFAERDLGLLGLTGVVCTDVFPSAGALLLARFAHVLPQ